MLRFITLLWLACFSTRTISIHPMLRFIQFRVYVPEELDGISIHPMLRFIPSFILGNSSSQLFQYIQCYGSSHLIMSLLARIVYFNTSNVTVHLIKQYYQQQQFSNFNTSNVTVHQRQCIYSVLGPCISIHPMLRFIFSAVSLLYRCPYFNTSNVTVHRRVKSKYEYFYRISIHPMLRFIISSTWSISVSIDFNTSNVTVHRTRRHPRSSRTNFNTSNVTVHRT